MSESYESTYERSYTTEKKPIIWLESLGSAIQNRSSIQHIHTLYLIVCAPTGIIYEHSCGGALCRERYAEGYLITVPEYWYALDDCEFGCTYFDRYYDEEELELKGGAVLRRKFSLIIDEKLQEINKKVVDKSINLRFDFERVDELLEAWWPVLIDWNGQKEVKGFLCGINCD